MSCMLYLVFFFFNLVRGIRDENIFQLIWPFMLDVFGTLERVAVAVGKALELDIGEYGT